MRAKRVPAAAVVTMGRDDCYSLGFGLVQDVQLLTHLSDGVVVLLAQVGHGLFMLDVGLFQVTAEFGHLCLATLVQLDLRGGRTTSLFQSLTQFLDFTRKIGSLFLSLCSRLALGVQFLFQFLDPGL